MIAFFEALFGPYPFDSFGAIVDDDTRRLRAGDPDPADLLRRRADEVTVAHELAHQWFGDASARSAGSDIWLNEGWATYAEWLWTEKRRPLDAPSSAFDNSVRIPRRRPRTGRCSIADPGALGLFADPVYDRGAATLHALRHRRSATRRSSRAREWLERFDDSTATTEDFQAVYEEVSGQDLDEFFQIWLCAPEKPTNW